MLIIKSIFLPDSRGCWGVFIYRLHIDNLDRRTRLVVFLKAYRVEVSFSLTNGVVEQTIFYKIAADHYN